MRAAPLLIVGFVMGLAPCQFDADVERAPPVTPQPQPQPPLRMELEPLQLEIWDCESWTAAGACELRVPTELTVVTRGQTAPFVLGGAVARVSQHVMSGARVLTASVAVSTTLRLEAGHRVGTIDVVMLDPRSARSRMGALLHAEHDAAAEALARVVLAEGTPIEQAYAVSTLARVAVRSKREVEAQALFDDAVARFTALGLGGSAARDLATIAWIQGARRDQPEAARATLAKARLLAQGLPEQDALIAFYEAVAKRTDGDRRGALGDLRGIMDQTAAGGARDLRRHAMISYASILHSLGRTGEARAVLDEVRSLPAIRECMRVRADSVLVWMAWAEREMTEDRRTDGHQARALQLADALLQTTCWDDHLAEDSAIDVALLAQSMGDGARLTAARARARALGEHAKSRHWWSEIDAREALAEGRVPDAVRIYTAEAARAVREVDANAEWLAVSGLARAQSLMGSTAAALVAGARAHELAGVLIRRAPFGEGRQLSAALFERVSDEHLRRLLDAGQIGAALQVARDLRARPLRELTLAAALAERSPATREAMARFRGKRAAFEAQLRRDADRSTEDLQRQASARARAQLEVDQALDEALELVTDEPSVCQPTAIEPNELLLVQHDSPRGSYLFASRGGEVTVRKLDARAPVDWLTPLLEGVHRLRVIEPEDATEPVEDRMLGARRLGEQFPVVHALDTCSRAPRPRADRPATLVVDNPTGDLGFTDEEVAAVAALSRRVTRHSRAAAQAPAVLADLGAAEFDLFHYSGHAVHQGIDGWGARLVLEGDQRLGVPDVLALGRVPRQAVLSACESGGTRGQSAPLLGLGQAFVIAGAEEVLVTDRKVYAKQTTRLMTALYAERAQGHDLSTALFNARQKLAEADPDSRELLDGYQVLVP